MNTVAGLEDATPLGLLGKDSRLARGGVCRCGGKGKLGNGLAAKRHKRRKKFGR